MDDEKSSNSNAKAKTYGSVDKLIESTSTPVVINGEQYRSVRQAAKFIQNQEDKIDHHVKFDTLRKRLRDMMKSGNDVHNMYAKYEIWFADKHE